MIEKLLGPLARRWAWVRTAIRVQERFGEIHGSYLASTITLAAFISIFPLLIVLVAVIGFISSNDPTLTGDIIRQLGVTGEAANTVTEAINTAQENKGKASIIGLVGLLWSGLGLIAALSFALDSVWQVKSRGIKDKLYGLLWLVGAGLIIGASVATTALVTMLPGIFAPLAVVVAVLVNLILWLFTMSVLPNRKVPVKSLLPGAVLGALGLEVLKLVGGIYVPRAVASSSAVYGSIGIVFALLAWLLFFGRLVVYASTLNVIRWEEDHGTVTVEIEVPNLPDEVPTEANRSGEALPIENDDEPDDT